MGRADAERLDAAELKITLTCPDVDQALTEFNLTGDHARRSRIYFCELPAWGGWLALLDSGLILRLRAHHDGREDVTVKLRPCRPECLTPRWTRLHKTGEHQFRLETDWSSARPVLAASLIKDLPHNGVDDALARHDGPGQMLSTLQREFLAECADIQLNLDDLQALGPIHAHRWTLDTDNLHIAAERWTIPNTDIDLLELSVRSPPADAPLVQAALTAFVRRHGLDPDAFTDTKTRFALDHLSNRR